MEGVFYNLTSVRDQRGAAGDRAGMAPRLSAHWSAISMHPVLFARLDDVFRSARTAWAWMRNRCGCWNAITWISSVPARSFRARPATGWRPIAQRLAVLGTQFGQNVLGDEEDWVLPISAKRRWRALPRPRAMPPPPRPNRSSAMQPSPSACRAPVSSLSCNMPMTGACASSSSAPGPRAAAMAMPATIPASSARCWPCAPNAPAAGL